MDRDEVKELHFITSIDNLDSILMRGILCHNRARRLPHRSVASESVQDIRHGKSVPGGLSLHNYANLYFHARNPMMYYLKHLPDLVVVRVSPDVLDIPDTVITDGNAATWNTRFEPSPGGLANLDSELIFATYWTDDNNYMRYLEKKRARNAEVLVPYLVPSEYIEGCYVDTKEKRRACEALQKIVYFATVAGLPTGLEFQRASYGPFAPDLKAAVGRLQNNGILTEHQRGRMIEVRTSSALDDARTSYSDQLAKWSGLIDQLVDLVARFDNTRAEIAATVHYASQDLSNQLGRNPTVAEVVDYVEDWKRRRSPKLERTDILRAIVGLGTRGWLQVDRDETTEQEIDDIVVGCALISS